MLLSKKYFLYCQSERGAAEEKLPPQTCAAQVNSRKRLYPRDGGEGVVFSDVSSPRGRVKTTKRRAALHICDPKSAEKSMPRRVVRIAYTTLYIYIFNRRVDHEPAPRGKLSGLLLKLLTTLGCNRPDRTI